MLVPRAIGSMRTRPDDKHRPEPRFSFARFSWHMLAVFISCLGFLCCHLVVGIFGFAITSQVIGLEDQFLPRDAYA